MIAGAVHVNLLVVQLKTAHFPVGHKFEYVIAVSVQLFHNIESVLFHDILKKDLYAIIKRKLLLSPHHSQN